MSDPVLDVKNLAVVYGTARGDVRAVDEVSFSVSSGERLGLVGESGSGKSTIAFSILRLIKEPGRITGGEILFHGRDLTALSHADMQKLRLSEIAMIPQGAMNSLNPVAKVKHQIIDGLYDHAAELSKSEIKSMIDELLARVGLKSSVADLYPHELSGGMKQRVTIAISVSMNPKLIIADEPTSALDVVVQRQIIETLLRLQEDLQSAMILIGHDMGIMAQATDKIAVMYAGKLVEIGPAGSVLKEPLHPYAKMLIGSLPSLAPKDEQRNTLERGGRGLTPSLTDLPSGCIFHPRCPRVMDVCRSVVPPLEDLQNGKDARHSTACHLYNENGSTNG